MNEIAAIGLDLAKDVFQVHGVDDAGQVVCRGQLRRSQVPAFFARLQPCLIGMEACGAMHYWSRKLSELRHSEVTRAAGGLASASLASTAGRSAHGADQPSAWHAAGVRDHGPRRPQRVPTVVIPDSGRRRQ